jgi:Transglycosylase associated protein
MFSNTMNEHCRLSEVGIHSRSRATPVEMAGNAHRGGYAWIFGLDRCWIDRRLARRSGYERRRLRRGCRHGGLLGGWLFGQMGIWPAGGMVGSIIVAFIGAVILVGITRLESLTTPLDIDEIALGLVFGAKNTSN